MRVPCTVRRRRAGWGKRARLSTGDESGFAMRRGGGRRGSAGCVEGAGSGMGLIVIRGGNAVGDGRC